MNLIKKNEIEIMAFYFGENAGMFNINWLNEERFENNNTLASLNVFVGEDETISDLFIENEIDNNEISSLLDHVYNSIIRAYNKNKNDIQVFKGEHINTWSISG